MVHHPLDGLEYRRHASAGTGLSKDTPNDEANIAIIDDALDPFIVKSARANCTSDMGSVELFNWVVPNAVAVCQSKLLPDTVCVVLVNWKARNIRVVSKESNEEDSTLGAKSGIFEDAAFFDTYTANPESIICRPSKRRKVLDILQRTVLVYLQLSYLRARLTPILKLFGSLQAADDVALLLGINVLSPCTISRPYSFDSLSG